VPFKFTSACSSMLLAKKDAFFQFVKNAEVDGVAEDFTSAFIAMTEVWRAEAECTRRWRVATRSGFTP